MVATNPLSSLMGGGGDPPASNLSPQTSLFVRDALTGLIGRGTRDLKDQEAKNAFAYLRGAIGNSAANRLMTQVILFNNRSDMTGVAPAKRVQSFYDMGSNDPGTHTLIKQLGSLGSGPVAGFTDMPDLNSMIASKRDTSAGPGAGTANLAAMQKKVTKLR